MHGQIKANYGHVTISSHDDMDEIVIHIDAKHFNKIDISLLCSSFPSNDKVRGTKLFHIDPYLLTNLKKPVNITTESSSSKTIKKKNEKKSNSKS